MVFKFWGTDFGSLAIGRAILKKNPAAELEFFVGDSEKKEKNATHESDFWADAIREIFRGVTRFGRVAIIFDRKNLIAKNFTEKISVDPKYSPQEKRRGEATPKIFPTPVSILAQMANEGFADSVEFRRLWRKFLRPLRHAHVDTIFFAEAIFAEEKTRQILQQICGTQIKCFFVTDFLPENLFEKSEKQSIKITTGDDIDFTRERAEKILRTKLGKNSFESRVSS
ncbi:hypothetical protein HN954_05100 [bacterium]|jgi:hypothetical protein|nr:hypothetical protein [bacterium]MBT6832326.1 hypothetical protein [bacterium]MBT6996771.1 hypothetical protein [bacterium]MBT7772816.1 hypothetical protein [bacterium]